MAKETVLAFMIRISHMKYELKAFIFKETIPSFIRNIVPPFIISLFIQKAAVHELKEQSLRALKRQFLR